MGYSRNVWFVFFLGYVPLMAQSEPTVWVESVKGEKFEVTVKALKEALLNLPGNQTSKAYEGIIQNEDGTVILDYPYFEFDGRKMKFWDGADYTKKVLNLDHLNGICRRYGFDKYADWRESGHGRCSGFGIFGQDGCIVFNAESKFVRVTHGNNGSSKRPDDYYLWKIACKGGGISLPKLP